MMWRARLAILLGLAAVAVAQIVPSADGGGEGAKVTEATEPVGSTRPPLTGDPQIDYKWHPNLPFELIGYDLSNYPFYNGLPKDLLTSNFTCDGRHDGFYASIPHRCQVYHNCLFSQRYDFLCANFTVFDQKNFICHYVSEVDCEGSEKHYDRNELLYVTTTTTTPAPVAPQIIYVDRPRPLRGQGRIKPKNPRRPSFGGGGAGGGGDGNAGGGGGGKRRPGKRRPGGRRTTTTTPAPDYYDDYYDDYYYDDYYGDEESTPAPTTTARPRRRLNRPRGGSRPRQGGSGGQQGNGNERSGTRGTGPRDGGERPRGGGDRQGGSDRQGGRDRQRSRNNPADAPEESTDPRASRLQAGGARDQELGGDGGRQDPQPSAPAGGSSRRRANRPRPTIKLGGKKQTTTTTTTTTEAPVDYYYDEYYDYAEETPDTTTTTAAPSRRVRPSSRTRVRGGNVATESEAATEGTLAAEERDNVRVNVRRTPVIADRQPAENEEPAEPIQRQGPRFPSRRGSSTAGEPQVEEEEAPVVDEVGEPVEEEPTSRRANPRRRPSRQGPAPPPQTSPADYYYDY